MGGQDGHQVRKCPLCGRRASRAKSVRTLRIVLPLATQDFDRIAGRLIDRAAGRPGLVDAANCPSPANRTKSHGPKRDCGRLLAEACIASGAGTL